MTRLYSLLGPAWPEYGWVPAPRYLLRRDRILAMLRPVPSCRILEVGCGAGALLHELSANGFSCSALEASKAARELAVRVGDGAPASLDLHSEPQPYWQGQFALVMACDVLEHIEDDGAALRQWRQWLAPDGRLLLSVPAHQHKWSEADVWAGHYRRYEREKLAQLVEQSGFSIERFECYGFPLANLSEMIGAYLYTRTVIHDGADTESARRSNNDRSGIDRSSMTRLFPLLNSLPGRLLLRLAFTVQRSFLRLDIGSGYLIMARRT